eukprot:8497037-Pyramimonas_sp.AAC.1
MDLDNKSCPMFDLVFYKVADVAFDFNFHFTSDLNQVWGPLLGVCDSTDECECLAEAVIHSLEVAAGFHMRASLIYRRYPYLLLWLVKSDAESYCEDRRACAAHLLAAPRDALDDATQKLRALFRRELECAKDSGTLPCHLYLLLVDIGLQWTTNTQELEGMNNVVKSIGRSAPHIGWPLLSARLTSKKDI